MPPKTRITKENIINIGIELVRKKGESSLNARAIAKELGCSTQPVFSNFKSMDTLRSAVIERCEELFSQYSKKEEEEGRYPVYKANGMAYIRFAKEEKELFKLLYMRDRSGEIIPKETGLGNRMEGIVHDNTGLEGDVTKLFHLEMWAYVHGIASMFATGYLDIEWELVSKMLTDAYEGLKKQYKSEE